MSETQPLLAPIFITKEKSILAQYEACTFDHGNTVAAVAFPETTAEVSDIVKYCQREHIRLYPVSAGRNWGFGSKAPVCDDVMILDLSRMNKIDTLDLSFGTVRVQAGVTFEQLCEAVYSQTDDYVVNIIGGSPKASVVGNLLERGDGTSTYADRCAFMVNMEVVLPDGSIIRTGHGAYENCKTADLFKHGLGPALDQLFIQSNLGIVTSLTLWLQPRHAYVETFSLAIADQAKAAALVEKLRHLRLTNTINTNVALWNDYRSLSTLLQVGEQEHVVTRDALKDLAGMSNLMRWFSTFSVHSVSAEIAIAARHYILEQISDCCDEIVLIIRNNQAPDTSFFTLKGEQKNPSVFGKLEALSGVMNGQPSYQSQRSCYWRKKMEVPETIDPDRDRCGVLWAGVTIPIAGKNFDEVTTLVEGLMLAHGFEPHLTLLFPCERAGYCLAMLTYDRDVAGADEAAQDCHDRILEACRQKGYYPYRLGIQSMKAVAGQLPAYTNLMQTLKQTLDPNDTFAPGRYDFRHLWQ